MLRTIAFAITSGALACCIAAPPPAAAHDGAIDWQPAGKDCYILSNSHHGFTKESALEQSQAGLPILIEDFRRDRHWSKVRLRVSPHQAKPNPSLRSEVPEENYLRPDVETANSYTQCWTGVIWPVVCTSGAKVCRK